MRGSTSGLKKGWAKARYAPYAKEFREQCGSGLSQFKNNWTLLARQGKRGKRKAKFTHKKFLANLQNNQTRWERKVGQILTDAGMAFKDQLVFTFQTMPRNRIVDFLIPEGYLAIEIDGSQHYSLRGLKKDSARDIQFKTEYPHVRFIRYSNLEVDQAGFAERLLSEIKAAQGA